MPLGPARLYLDVSLLNRPYDDQAQPRVRSETEALLAILRMVNVGRLEILSSAVIRLENAANPFPDRKRWIELVMSLAVGDQMLDERVERRAKELEAAGVKPVDALHAASAEVSGAQYFLTCDDRFIRRYKGPLAVMNPVDFLSVHPEM